MHLPPAFVAAVLWACRLLWAGFVLFYGLLFVSLCLVAARLAWARSRAVSPPSQEASAWRRFRRSTRESLLFNDVAAIVSTVFGLAVIGWLPVQEPARRAILLLFVAVTPYSWGFARATGVGICSGGMGNTIGLLWLGATNPAFGAFTHAPFLLGVGLLGAFSGFLGGYVGRDQVRDSQCVSVFRIEMGDAFDLPRFVAVAERAVADAHQHDAPLREVRLEDLVVAEQDDGVALLRWRRDVEWRVSKRPFTWAMGWILRVPDPAPPVDVGIDHMLNFWRWRVVRLMVTFEKPARLLVVVPYYWETPSIVWVDRDIRQWAGRAFVKIAEALQGDPGSTVLASSHHEVRLWGTTPGLEQRSKQTPSARDARAHLRGRAQKSGEDLPPAVIAALAGAPRPTWLRGRTATFVTFLGLQVVLGVGLKVLLDWLSGQLTL